MDNIVNYKLVLDNNTVNTPLTLNKTVDQIRNAIKDKLLSSDFTPLMYLVDTYNKVFALQLENNLFIPVYPSKLNTDLDYKIIDKYDTIALLKYKQTINLLDKVNKICNLNNIPISKILSIDKNSIQGIYTESNRIIPTLESPIDNDKLKISNYNIYKNVDYYLNNNIEFIDNRVKDINNINYENETYNRIKFEIARYFKINSDKERVQIFNEIVNIINDELMEFSIKRDRIIKILLKLFNKLVSISDSNKNIDILSYEKSNKRIPCFTNTTRLSCNEDYHCIYNNGCKVFMFEKNLLNNKNNKIVYIAMISEELLRYKIKRNEILDDKIPDIINKNIIKKNPDKYYIINTNIIKDIINSVESIFIDNKGIFINNIKLWENSLSRYDGFDISKYIESNITLNNLSLQNDLSGIWAKVFGYSYVVQKNPRESLFMSLSYALNSISNEKYNEEIIKKILIDFINKFNVNNISFLNNNNTKFIKYINKVFNKNNKLLNIYDLYNESNFKFNKILTSYDELTKKIALDIYTGCEIDIFILGYIFKINIIVLDKRFSKKIKGSVSYLIEGENNNKYIFLYKNIKLDKIIYDIIKRKNKFVFNILDLPVAVIDKLIK